MGCTDVDAVVVATPSATHTELALATLAAGKHLYLEKPVGISEPDADRLASLAASVDRVVAVGFNRRFHPAVIEARRRLASGELGRIVSIQATFEEPMTERTMPGWKRRRATGGGAPLDLGSHHVDVVRLLLGRELRAVGSVLRSVRSELDDCSLRFDADGCRVTIDCSFVRGRHDVIELEDERGRISSIDRYAGTLRVRGRPTWSAALLRARARAVLRPHADPSVPARAARVREPSSRRVDFRPDAGGRGREPSGRPRRRVARSVMRVLLRQRLDGNGRWRRAIRARHGGRPALGRRRRSSAGRRYG